MSLKAQPVNNSTNGPEQRLSLALLPWIFRLRYVLHVVIYVLGFWAPWNAWLGLRTERLWLLIPETIAAQNWLPFRSGIVAITLLAVLSALSGAMLRTWGTAYLGASTVSSPSLHADRVLANGPYRYCRNPLYLGTILHTISLVILMTPSGGVFTIVAIVGLQLHLIASEETYLARCQGAMYLAYKKLVPRLLPSLLPRMQPGTASPRWAQAFLGEIYFWGVALAFAALGWQYNAIPILQALLVALGVSLVLKALRPNSPACLT